MFWSADGMPNYMPMGHRLINRAGRIYSWWSPEQTLALLCCMQALLRTSLHTSRKIVPGICNLQHEQLRAGLEHSQSPLLLLLPQNTLNPNKQGNKIFGFFFPSTAHTKLVATGRSGHIWIPAVKTVRIVRRCITNTPVTTAQTVCRVCSSFYILYASWWSAGVAGVAGQRHAHPLSMEDTKFYNLTNLPLKGTDRLKAYTFVRDVQATFLAFVNLWDTITNYLYWLGVSSCNLQTEICYFKDPRYPLFIKLSLIKFKGYSQNWKMFFSSMIYALRIADLLTC